MTDLPSIHFSSKISSKNLTEQETFSMKSLSTLSSNSTSLFWRRRHNCCTNFYSILLQITSRNTKRRRKAEKLEQNLARKKRMTQSVGGDFVYSNAYEVLMPTPRHSPNCEEKASTDLYLFGSESLHITPPPLPLRNLSQSPTDSISPQPRPDIGRCISTEPPASTSTPPPETTSGISKWSEKYRKTVFTNRNFEPLIEEESLHFPSSSPVSPTPIEETISVQIHRDTSSTPKRSINPKLQEMLRPFSREEHSRPISREDHFRPFSSSEVQRRASAASKEENFRPFSKMELRSFSPRTNEETISINSRLFADDFDRTYSGSQRPISESSHAPSEKFRPSSNLDRHSTPAETPPVSMSPIKLEHLDIFKVNKHQNSDLDDSLILETDYYVRQMKMRRHKLMSQIDNRPSDRWRRKVGYEIERRLVRAIQARTFRNRYKKRRDEPTSMSSWLHGLMSSTSDKNEMSPHDKRRARRRRLRRHHRFCLKCITSSFKALFLYLGRPIFVLSKPAGAKESQNLTYFGATPGSVSQHEEVKEDPPPPPQPESRTPTPKMLLNAKNGTLHWPVYQVGGTPGSGMLISTSSMLQLKKTKSEEANQPGRENFLLGEQITHPLSPPTTKVGIGDDDNKLIGWLQVRDSKLKKKSFLQVVNPAPEGPFRKAPWHGNIHVLKF